MEKTILYCPVCKNSYGIISDCETCKVCRKEIRRQEKLICQCGIIRYNARTGLWNFYKKVVVNE